MNALVLVGAVVRGFPYTQHFYTRGGHLPEGIGGAELLAYYAGEDPYEIYRENKEVGERLEELVRRAYRREERRFHGSFSGPVALEHLAEIHVPTLILVGEFDIPDVHAYAGAINAGIPESCREVISKAGHLIPLEQPERFNQVVLEFLKGR